MAGGNGTGLSDLGNSRARYHTAAGSAAEARAGVRAALARGYVSLERVGFALAKFDAILAIVGKLTRE